MLLSLSLLLSLGWVLGALAKKIGLPPLCGMLACGVLLGPFALDLLSPELLALSPVLRRVALLIILMRAGLGLDLDALRRASRPALLMCFVPACFEMLGVILLAPRLLHVSTLDAALIGAALAAVSPAVVVPRMLRLDAEGYGTARGIPQLIMAGASVDDVFVIVAFTSFTAMAQGGAVSAAAIVRAPVSIVLGIMLGIACGYGAARLLRAPSLSPAARAMLLLALCFALVALEDALTGPVAVSGLLAIMTAGAVLRRRDGVLAAQLSGAFEALWVPAELLLFSLVGATVDVRYAALAGAASIAVVLGALLFRAVGVLLCLTGTALHARERLFCVFAYLPKATVQAAIGGIPLALGLPCGNAVLTAAVLAILITAPLGALLIDRSYQMLLSPVSVCDIMEPSFDVDERGEVL